MYDDIILKNTNHFKPEGILFFSKFCDYYNINKVSIDDIRMFYDLLNSEELINNNNINKKTLISCCLYYLSNEENQYKVIFMKEIIQRISRDDPINDANLILIYNIIEFDKRFLDSKQEKQKYLLEYLERFSGHKKNLENFLLYKYYRGLLKLRLNQTNDAYKEYLEIITAIEEYVKQKTDYINFIKLQNDLLKVRLDLNKHIENEYYEQYLFMKDLFDKVKNENTRLGIKLGFCLYELLCRQKKYYECIPLLVQMKKILKESSFSESNIKTHIDYSLAILSRMAYMGVLLGNKDTVFDARKKLISILKTIENDKFINKKLEVIYNAYDFVISILNIYLGNYENKLKEKASVFSQKFIHENNNKSSKNSNNIIKKCDYIINSENNDYSIIDLHIINNMDTNIDNLAKEIMKNYKEKLSLNNLNSNEFLGYIVYMHNNISRLSQSFCTDESIKKRKEYIIKINEHYSLVFNYVRMNINNESLLGCDFVKSILINIQQAAASANFNVNNINEVKKLIIFFDNIKKSLGINDETTSYELMNKIKGDYWLKTGDYPSAISYYCKTLKKMKNNDPKKPIVYFNLGCAFYFEKNIKEALLNLNLSINAFRTFEYEKKTYDVLLNKEVVMKKVRTIKKLIKIIGN